MKAVADQFAHTLVVSDTEPAKGQGARDTGLAKATARRRRLLPDAIAVNRAPTSRHNNGAFIARFAVLQLIGGAAIAGLGIADLAQKPFQGDNAVLCSIIVGIAVLGLVCVYFRRWRDVQWLATNVVRVGLLGTVVGLIIAFSAATTGGAASDPSTVKPMIAAVVNGMYVSLYATLLGVAVNLWLKINLRLLGGIDG